MIVVFNIYIHMKPNIIEEKSYQFAIKIVNLYKKLSKEPKEYVMGRQILKCGTSIGANVAEALGSISKREFVMKIQISYKEAHETKYWLRILHDTNHIDSEMFKSLFADIEEIIRILLAILKSSKKSLKLSIILIISFIFSFISFVSFQ